MPTSQTTNTTNQYNKSGMNAYNAFQPQLMSQLMAFSQNPLGSNYFQHQLAQQQAAAQQINQRGQSNALQNLRTGGGILSNSGGYTNSLINRNQLTGSVMQSNAFNTAMNSALQNRNMSLMSMQAYNPLQTGQKSVQSTGGVGTWLGPIVGAAANLLMPGLGSLLGGGSFKAGYGGGGAGGGGPMGTSTPISAGDMFGGMLG